MPRLNLRSSLCALVFLLAAAGQAACSSDDGAPSELTADDLTGAAAVWATPEWPDRRAWYTTPQGSHLIDYGVFMALEADSGVRFASPENLRPLGFLYPPKGVTGLTADARLPLGLVKDRDEARGEDALGFTCAACHTGVIDVKGRGRVLVDGGQPFLQFDELLVQLQGALQATQSEGARKSRFCAALSEGTPCDARLDEAAARVDAIQGRNRVTVASGPGRMDAISRILNEVLGGQLGAEPPGPVAVPVSVPAIWDAPKLSCAQTNCLARNSMTRNIGEVLGVFGHSFVVREGKKVVVTGTPKVDNLLVLERALESLQSPKWIPSLFGAIEPGRRARGEAVFSSTCAGCHTEPYKTGAPASAFVVETTANQTHAFWNVTTLPFRDVGTDPAFIEVHGARMVDDPLLTELFDQALWNKIAEVLGKDPTNVFDRFAIGGAFALKKTEQLVEGLRTPTGAVKSLLVLGAITGGIETSAIRQRTQDPVAQEALRHELELYRAPISDVDLAVYRARPLDGIAFTAPYGHNGAWPTLADVLAPPSERPTTFVVRPGSFDPERVGLDTTPAAANEPLFQFDTRQVGNRNTGHTWGTDLSPRDKADLLEYLKSL